jgi:hypothetical protein
MASTPLFPTAEHPPCMCCCRATPPTAMIGPQSQSPRAIAVSLDQGRHGTLATVGAVSTRPLHLECSRQGSSAIRVPPSRNSHLILQNINA